MPRPLKARSEAIGEEKLIEAANRNPGRFAELYESHFERVYAYAVSRVRDRSEAEDVTAEVFHQALRNLPKFEWRGVPFAAWLYRIASNAIADRAHRLSREQTVDAPEQIDERDFEAAEHTAQIFRLVKELPDDQRRVLEMRF